MNSTNYLAMDTEKRIRHQQLARRVAVLQAKIAAHEAEIKKIQDQQCTHYMSAYVGNGWHECGACGKTFGGH